MNGNRTDESWIEDALTSLNNANSQLVSAVIAFEQAEAFDRTIKSIKEIIGDITVSAEMLKRFSNKE